jgi:hypothetical protein
MLSAVCTSNNISLADIMTPIEQINQWMTTFRFWVNLDTKLHSGHGMSEKQREYRRNWVRKRMQDEAFVKRNRARKLAWLDRGNNREKDRERARLYYKRNREKILARMAAQRLMSKNASSSTIK